MTPKWWIFWNLTRNCWTPCSNQTARQNKERSTFKLWHQGYRPKHPHLFAVSYQAGRLAPAVFQALVNHCWRSLRATNTSDDKTRWQWSVWDVKLGWTLVDLSQTRDWHKLSCSFRCCSVSISFQWHKNLQSVCCIRVLGVQCDEKNPSILIFIMCLWDLCTAIAEILKSSVRGVSAVSQSRFFLRYFEMPPSNHYNPKWVKVTKVIKRYFFVFFGDKYHLCLLPETFIFQSAEVLPQLPVLPRDLRSKLLALETFQTLIQCLEISLLGAFCLRKERPGTAAMKSLVSQALEYFGSFVLHRHRHWDIKCIMPFLVEQSSCRARCASSKAAASSPEKHGKTRGKLKQTHSAKIS